MIEYPSINNSSKAPRKECLAFNKLDGSNVRFKWTQKQGFSVFGTRTQLIDETTPYWGQVVDLFKSTLAAPLDKFFRTSKDYRDYREIICFGEFFGPDSFAGRHKDGSKKIVLFDILLGHKQRKLVLPQQFIKDFSFIETPEVVYRGVLNDSFIESVRNSTTLNEGVICKGVERSGAAFGGVWMAKIKTRSYFDRLRGEFPDDYNKYWE
jgi:hypothetical protein